MSQQQQLQQGAVGIDIGSWRSVIAVAKRGGVEVITNEANFRETPSVVGYGPNERFIGESGSVKMKTNFRDTVSYPTRFLGLHNEYPLLTQETRFVPAKTVKSYHGKLHFQVNYQGQPELFVAEQVVGAYIGKLRNIIQINKLANTEAVLSVPSYYTQIERKSLLDAAKIAELHVTRLINECTAVALDYGMFRKNDLHATNARNVLFIDFGHSKLSAFVCSFTKDKMTTLAQCHERNLGCRDIDYILLQFYKNVFEKSSGGLDVFESRKAVVKLMENIEKQRKILSANSEHTMNLEYLMEENDLNYNLKREEFEKLTEPVLQKAEQLFEKIKSEINEKKIVVHGIEMVGGGTRIPAFIKIIEKVFKSEPSRTLNSSESIARGCALMAAMKSPLFKVAEYGLEYINAYPIKLHWNFIQAGTQPLANNDKAYPEKQTNMIFAQNCILPTTKTIKFSKKEAIELLVTYDPPVEGFSRYVAYYKTPAQNPKEADFNVIFKLRLNENGIVVLEECFLQEDYMEETKVPKPKKYEKKDDKKDEKKDDKKEEAAPAEYFEIKQNKKTRQTPLKYEFILLEKTTAKEIYAYFEAESKMKNQDKLIFETYERKNELESLIYNNKEKLTSTYKPFVNPAEVPKLLETLETANTWLYDQGQQASRGQYTEKIDHLKPFFEPIARRYHAAEDLKESYFKAAQVFKEQEAAINNPDPKLSHISKEERNEALAEIEKVKQIFNNSQKLQYTVNGWDNPITSSHEVNTHINQLVEKVRKTMSKPVPPPPPKEEKPTTNPAGYKMEVENPAGAKNEAGESKPASQPADSSMEVYKS